MAIAQGNVFELRLNYSVFGQKCVNVLHYKNTQDIPDPVTPNDLQERFLFLHAGPGDPSFATELSKLLAQNVTITTIECQQIWPQRWRKSLKEIGLAGVRPFDCTAPNVQASAAKYGQLAERASIGGIHVGGVAASDYEFGEITNAHFTRMGMFMDYLMTQKVLTIPNTNMQFVIANKVEVVPPTDPPKYRYDGSENVIETEVFRQIRTQRTRTVGKGV